MLCDVSEVTCETELFCQLICCSCSKSIVQPVIAHRSCSNFCNTVRSCCTKIIICEASYIITICIFYSCILTTQCLIFKTCTVVNIQEICDIPVMSKVKCQFVFISVVILRSIFVQVVIITVACVCAASI